MTICLQDPTISEAREIAMEQIRSGVKLRPVTPPSERTPTEEKVVDIQSELRQKIIKKRKKEVCFAKLFSLARFVNSLGFISTRSN